jgi:hypothetical protein
MSDLSVNTRYTLNQAQGAQAEQIAQSGSLTAEEAQAFSQALAQEMALLQGSQTGTSAATSASPLSLYTPMLMNATAGQSLESQILMLLMLMTTGQMDASSLMSVLAQSVTQMQSESEKEKLRRSVMDSSYANDLLDQVNQGVFAGATSQYPYEAWKSCSPSLVNYEGNRSAAAYAQVISQFGVATNPRYQNNKRGTGDTYCNIFLWDVTSAMGAEIPHYIDAATGAPRSYPNTTGAVELSANATYDWLAEHGQQYGWVEVTAQEAQAHANEGGPAVTCWYNTTGGSGHVQVIRPEVDAQGYDPQRGVAVAQAGSTRTEYTHANDIFSDRAMAELKYYIHR